MFAGAKRQIRLNSLLVRGRLAAKSVRKRTIDRCNEKRIILTVNAGRSGSKKLTQLFSCIDGVDAHHEPEPSFHRYMRASQRRRDVARAFLLVDKLPAILNSPNTIYFESSHLFSKGFLEAAFELGLRFGLVHLHRDPSAIARSFFRLSIIPGRTQQGLTFCVAPYDPVFLRLPEWQKMSDYQLCYWYALEMAQRAKSYLTVASLHNLETATILFDDLPRAGGFERLCSQLRIPIDQGSAGRIEAIRASRVNEKRKVSGRPVPPDATEQECSVINGIIAVPRLPVIDDPAVPVDDVPQEVFPMALGSMPGR